MNYKRAFDQFMVDNPEVQEPYYCLGCNRVVPYKHDMVECLMRTDDTPKHEKRTP